MDRGERNAVWLGPPDDRPPLRLGCTDCRRDLRTAAPQAVGWELKTDQSWARRPAGAPPSRQQPPAGGVADQLGGVVDAQLLHQPAAVVVGRLDADPQVAGDLLGGAAVD